MEHSLPPPTEILPIPEADQPAVHAILFGHHRAWKRAPYLAAVVMAAMIWICFHWVVLRYDQWRLDSLSFASGLIVVAFVLVFVMARRYMHMSYRNGERITRDIAENQKYTLNGVIASRAAGGLHIVPFVGWLLGAKGWSSRFGQVDFGDSHYVVTGFAISLLPNQRMLEDTVHYEDRVALDFAYHSHALIGLRKLDAAHG